MRNLLLGTSTFAGALLIAGHSVADPGGTVLKPEPPVHITSFGLPVVLSKPGMPPLVPKYTSGPINVTVTVQNSNPNPANNVELKMKYGAWAAGEVSTIIPTIGAKSSTTITLVDPKGLDSICHPRPYELFVTSDGQTDQKIGEVTPSCTFTTSLVDPWNLAEPDRVDEQQKGAAYFTNAALVGPPTCTTGVTVKGAIGNHTKTSMPSVLLQVVSKDPVTGKDVVRAQSPAAFPLAAGEFKNVTIPPYGRPDLTDVMTVQIVDWTHSLKPGPVNQGITVKTTKSCTLSARIPPALAMVTDTKH